MNNSGFIRPLDLFKAFHQTEHSDARQGSAKKKKIKGSANMKTHKDQVKFSLKEMC